MNDEKEFMAIICNVCVGTRDIGRPVLWFEARWNDCLCCLCVLEWDAAGDMLKGYDCYDLKSLEGKPCWMKGCGCIGGVNAYSRPMLIGKR